MKNSLSLILICLLLLISISYAGTQKHQKLMIKDAWSRTSPGTTGVVYLIIFNHSADLERLVSVTTNVAKRAEFHTHLLNNGIMKMRRLSDIEVNSMERVVLEPGGKHIMLFGLKSVLKVGQEFILTLFFERLGRVDVKVKVRKIGAMDFNDGGKILEKNTDHTHSK